MKRPYIVFQLVASISLVFADSAAAQDIMLDKDKAAVGKAEYSPYLDRGYPDRVYFGDTHLHTSYSTDAGMFGYRLGPDEAYRFARGEEVTSSTGLRRACSGRSISWSCPTTPRTSAWRR